MGPRPSPLAFSLAAMLVVTPTMRPAVAPAGSYIAVYEAFTAKAPNPARVANVTQLTITRDVGRFELGQGSLVLATPVAGREIAAVFIGQGTFHFTPPIDVEREQVQRELEMDPLVSPFRTLYMVFVDSTLSELESQLTFGPGTVPRDAAREIEEALKYLSDDDGPWVQSDLMTALLNDAQNDYFYAHFAENRGDPLFFMVTPYDEEGVTLGRRARGRGVRGDVRDIVSQFARQSILADTTWDPTTIDLVRLDNYQIESVIEDNLDFSAAAVVDVTTMQEDLRWVPLTLFYDLEVDSVVTGDGTPIAFYRGEESSTLWLDFGAPLDAGTAVQLTLGYHGELLEQQDVLEGMRRRHDLTRNRLVRLRSSTSWYPRHGSRRTAGFDLTFHSPAKYKFVSVGERLFDEVDGDVLTTRWLTPSIRNASFNLGEFEEHQITDPRIPPVTLQVAEELHRTLGMDAGRGGTVTFLTQRDIARQVSTDVANAMSFFQDFFGPSPMPAFYATEIPGRHGEAFPGLVHFSWLTYQWTSDDGTDEIFRAHEVAHQWWGIGVDFDSYRDQWLSEGFSDFAGIWYLQMIMGNNEKYFETLKEWREALTDRREDIAPIWLGYRASTIEHPGDYQLVVYQKGAWVLHMLRNLMLDLDTMSEEAFQMLMRDFYARYLGRRASTADFEAMVERHLGARMDWFFDQWVRGTAIPKYEYAYQVEEQPDGQFKARLRVEQSEVPEDFRMIVPVYLDFGDAGHARVRILVEGSVTEVELPILPLRPEQIVLNDLESVLAETRRVGWE